MKCTEQMLDELCALRGVSEKVAKWGASMELLIGFWLLFGVASAIVMNNKGRSGCAGFGLGFALGPFGLIIALVLQADSNAQEQGELQSGTHKKCPFCAELMRAEATKCQHCGSVLQKPLDA